MHDFREAAEVRELDTVPVPHVEGDEDVVHHVEVLAADDMEGVDIAVLGEDQVCE